MHVSKVTLNVRRRTSALKVCGVVDVPAIDEEVLHTRGYIKVENIVTIHVCRAIWQGANQIAHPLSDHMDIIFGDNKRVDSVLGQCVVGNIVCPERASAMQLVLVICRCIGDRGNSILQASAAREHCARSCIRVHSNDLVSKSRLKLTARAFVINLPPY